MLRFVKSRQTLIVIGTILGHMLRMRRGKFIANSIDQLFTTFLPGRGVGEVTVHATAIPVALDRFGMQRDGDIILLGRAVKQVPCEPEIVTGTLGTLAK